MSPNPINARKGIKTGLVLGGGGGPVSRPNPINARKGIKTDQSGA